MKQSAIKQNSGWTLLELLIVLAITGFLVMLALPHLTPVLDRQDKVLQKQLLLEMMGSLQLQKESDQKNRCGMIKAEYSQQLHFNSMTVSCEFQGADITLTGKTEQGQIALSNRLGFTYEL